MSACLHLLLPLNELPLPRGSDAKVTVRLLAFILAQCSTALHRSVSSGDSHGSQYLIRHIVGYSLKAQKGLSCTENVKFCHRVYGS